MIYLSATLTKPLSMPPPPLVTASVTAAGVATITLNSPSTLNALTEAMGDALSAVVDSLCARPSGEVRVVVLTGAGHSFSAGGELSFLEDRALRSTPPENSAVMRDFYARFLSSILRLEVPTIAAVRGNAFGAGFALACATDIRVISETARCSLNFTQLGLHPGMGSTFLLPRIVGREACNYLLMTGRRVDGKEAKELGLCLRAVPDGEVLAVARSIAADIAAAGPLSVRQVKASLTHQLDDGLERHLQREADAQAVGFGGDDFQGRLRALLERTRVRREAKDRAKWEAGGGGKGGGGSPAAKL